MSPSLTKLETFIRTRKLRPAQLARESGYSRQQLFRIRKGLVHPISNGVARIAAACRRLSGEDIRAADLFELDRD
jgi:predicted transcriptional regulator